MRKDHSEREREETRCRYTATLSNYMHHSTDRITYTTAFVTPVVEHWLEGDVAQWVPHEGSIRRPIAPSANALTTELYFAT